MTTARPEDIAGIYERKAREFDTGRSRVLFERAWLERFAALLPENAAVLDLGCGHAEPIASWLIAQGFSVTGVDTSPSLLALCRQRFPDHHWIKGDMRGLALEHRFNGIIAWDSFFHLSHDDQRAMFEVFRAHAAPGAALMFTSGPEHGEAFGDHAGEALYHASLAPEEYRALLSAAGFDVVGYTANDADCTSHTVWLAQRQR
ncbi:class I SAM-dependent methyltransferase [Ferrovibrio sp.]|uniref:class I SAM-dependent DNA methyltransferase n=1 Tax=Ferrovibrio sp. TaxID=1917215 RepID=UPI000CBD759D|nr:class I SAM-dependent methyltransferase [Ferrovibrio sp.]PJI44511.1 MAG: SAM-dependent methyltransferase [Ferrovibrio sp.]